MEVKNGIIIDGVLHEASFQKGRPCSVCSLFSQCKTYYIPLCGVLCCEGFINRGKVKIEKEEIDTLIEYLKAKREVEHYQITHDILSELKKEFPIGTKLKPCGGYDNAVVVGHSYYKNGTTLALSIKDNLYGEAIIKAEFVEKEETE